MNRMPITEILESRKHVLTPTATEAPLSTEPGVHGTQIRHLIDIRTQKRIARRFPRTRKLFVEP
jgi:hypothetical protein